MIDYKLKKEVTEDMLKEVGFHIYSIDNPKTMKPDKLASRGVIVVDLNSEERKIEWRYAGNENKDITDEIFDILIFMQGFEKSPHARNFDIPANNNVWCKMIHENAIKHGWWEEERNVLEIGALIHTEISEAIEEYRNGKPNVYEVDGKPEGVAVEMIDAVIRIMDWFGKEGLDFDEILATKYHYNLTRPYKHGKKI